MSALSTIPCAYCGANFSTRTAYVTRANQRGHNLYCGRECSGFGRRQPVRPTEEEKRAAKAEYDRQYRANNRKVLKAKKAEYFQRTYDPDAAREVRKLNMPRHVEYCRSPDYRKWKAEYDKAYLARKQYGPFADAAVILRELEQEVLSRASRYEIDLAAGRLNKAKMRKQEYGKAVGC